MRLAAIPFSVFLLALAISLLVLHLRAWNKARRDDLEPAERRHAHRQFRRRIQASAMLGVVAVAIPLGTWIPHRQWPSAFVFFWFAVAMLVVWVLALALVDALATSRQMLRTSRRNTADEVSLRAELKRRLLSGGNGHPPAGRSADW